MTDVPPPAAAAGDDAPEQERGQQGPRPTWRPWEALPVFAIAIVVGSLLVTPFVSPHPTTGQQLGAGIVEELSLAAAVLGWLYARHRASMGALGVPRRPSREVVVGVLAGLALYTLLVFGFGWILARILEAISSARHVVVPRQLPNHIQGPNAWMAGILVLVVAPVCEELFFRGFLFGSLRIRLGFASSAALSGIVFGLAHLQEAIPGPWQGAVLLVTVLAFVGFGLAFVYERRRNIVAAIGAHAAFNLFGFLVLLHVI